MPATPDIEPPEPTELPKRIRDTYMGLVDKVGKLQQAGEPVDRQIASIDWWIGQLQVMKALVRAGKKI